MGTVSTDVHLSPTPSPIAELGCKKSADLAMIILSGILLRSSKQDVSWPGQKDEMRHTLQKAVSVHVGIFR